jgi:uncharacterized protein YdaU (DUF1376 family)
LNYYEHHIGDYDQATAHLSAVEDGIYSRLIRWYMASEQALPSDVAAILRRVRAHTRDEKAAVKTVLAEFFQLHEDGYHQHRCDEEVERFKGKQAKARASADARWGAMRSASERNANASLNDDAPDMRTHSSSNANGMHRAPVPTHQSPDTNTSEPKVPRSRGSRLQPDWEPGEGGIAFAQQQGLANGKAHAELAKFRDYWCAQPGQKGVKTDWQATWRNWVRKATENHGGKPSGDDIFGGAK